VTVKLPTRVTVLRVPSSASTTPANPCFAACLHRLAARDSDVTQSDVVRGIRVAAQEDVLDASAPSRRAREIEALALAV